MKAEDLTIEMIAEKANLPAEEWHGNCHRIAWAVVDLIQDGATAPYGHYLGPVSREGYWAGRAGTIIQHGWAMLKDGTIIDPTRWSFEAKDPYVFIGEPGHPEYDEGGNGLREATTLTARARTWSGRAVSTERFSVDADGTVSVWDAIAGHYTTCHALSASAERRIRKIAASM